MADFNRRSVLLGTAATAAVLSTMSANVTAQTAAPATPATARQGPGFYRYKLGSFEATVVTDGANRFKLPDDMVANANKDEVNAALAAAYMEKDVFVGPYNPIVVN